MVEEFEKVHVYIGIRCFLCLCFLILPMFPKKVDDKFDSSDYGFIFAIVFLLVLMLVSDRYVRKIVNKDVHLMVKDNYTWKWKTMRKQRMK